MVINWNILVTDKKVKNFMLKKLMYWTPIKYGRRTYIMTFQYNVYEVTL